MYITSLLASDKGNVAYGACYTCKKKVQGLNVPNLRELDIRNGYDNGIVVSVKI